MKKQTLIFIATALFSGIPLIVSAQSWSDPTALPPNGNAAAPINVSSLVQTKGTVSIPTIPTPALGSLFIQGDFLSNTLSTNSLLVNGNATATAFCLGGACITTWPAGGNGGSSSKLVKYSNPGIYSWTVPNGVTEIHVRLVGAGGGGGAGGYISDNGADNGYIYSGAGGGAGGYCEGFFPVTPGMVIKVGVGLGGAGGTTVNTTQSVRGQSYTYESGLNPGGGGGSSWVIVPSPLSGECEADGGTGGGAGGNGTNGYDYAGGGGGVTHGTGDGDTFGTTGGGGGDSLGGAGSGGYLIAGGYGGASAFGGGGRAGVGGGTFGNAPGSGGGGDYAAGGSGGSGGNAIVILDY